MIRKGRILNKPVRNIGMNSRSVTGKVPGFGIYESTLERDFMELLRFESYVETFTAQPVTIEYRNSDGQVRSYTPDGLVQFKSIQGATKPPLLYEIKYLADFRKDWRVLLPKFRAAKSFAHSNHWTFEVFTESHIRGVYFRNIKFLWPYKQLDIDDSRIHLVLDRLADLQETDVSLLLCTLSHDKIKHAQFIQVVWHLISNFRVGCDLNEPINMYTNIWSLEEV